MNIKKYLPAIAVVAVLGAVLALSDAHQSQASVDEPRLIEVNGVYQIVCPTNEWPVSAETPLPEDLDDPYAVSPPAVQCLPDTTSYVRDHPVSRGYCPDGYGHLPNVLSGPGGVEPRCARVEYLAARDEQQQRWLRQLRTH